MALATQTGSQAAPSAVVRNIEKGVITIPFSYTSGTTAFSATAGTVLLCKIPHGATVLNYSIYHTSGATTCTADYGFALGSGGGLTASAFGSAQAKGAYNVANKGSTSTAFAAGVPQKISISDDAQPRFVYFTGSFTNSSATASLVVQGSITYTMDGI